MGIREKEAEEERGKGRIALLQESFKRYLSAEGRTNERQISPSSFSETYFVQNTCNCNRIIHPFFFDFRAFRRSVG